jgi:glycosyltransferase involved in cell wall biosynthesis
MRIAHLLGSAGDGGAELFYERLTIAMAQAGDDVLAAIRANPERAARLRQGGLAPQSFGFGGPFDLLTRPRLARALRRFQPAIAIAWMNRAARHAPRGPWVLAGRLGGYYDLRYYRHCDYLIGNTTDIVDWIKRQGWDASRVFYLPNFVADWSQAAPLRLVAPQPSDGAPRCLFAAGRLHRNKAFDVLIRAMAALPGIRLTIAGEGPERAALQDLARTEGVADRVALPGWVPDPAALMAGCDVFVCPSRHEPLGNVVIEAFSAGRPIVSTLADGPRALIEHGRNGLLVPIDDPTALAEAIRAVLEDGALARRLAEAGRARWQAEFAAAPVVARWQAALHQMGHQAGHQTGHQTGHQMGAG